MERLNVAPPVNGASAWAKWFPLFLPLQFHRSVSLTWPGARRRPVSTKNRSPFSTKRLKSNSHVVNFHSHPDPQHTPLWVHTVEKLEREELKSLRFKAGVGEILLHGLTRRKWKTNVELNQTIPFDVEFYRLCLGRSCCGNVFNS